MVDMDQRPRVYTAILAEHLAQQRQMAFVSGPRQVGKTTVCRALGTVYLSWDNEAHRELILSGAEAVARFAGLERLGPTRPVIVLDELHRYRHWRRFLKGFFDTYEDRIRVLVTGSSRLDVYRRGGDSLMGRYFPFRMHPFTVAEAAAPGVPAGPIRPPVPISDDDWEALLTHGGYPEPFVRRFQRFTTRWRDLRRTQLLREDVRDLTRIQGLDQLEHLERLLADRSGEQVVYSSLAKAVRVSENTVRSWVATLVSLHHGFLVRPWFESVARSLRKEPKWYLRDWSGVSDPGKRFETLCACHLLKAAQGWTDLGFGRFELRYLRDKDGREVDFLTVRDGRPWFLAEAKLSDEAVTAALRHFQAQTKAEHAFQVTEAGAFVPVDAFSRHDPVVVPARTFLSQLL
jgi:predicted AAA+ superfamily ATPase